jgi:hypothetical protein
MAAYINVNVFTGRLSQADLNMLLNPTLNSSGVLVGDSTKKFEGIQNLINLLTALQAGTVDGNLTAVTSTTTTTGTSTGSSCNVTFNLS